MINRGMHRFRFTTAIFAGAAATATALAASGCTVKDTVKTTDDLQSAPSMYGNALNRAHDVAGKVERKSSEGLPAERGKSDGE